MIRGTDTEIFAQTLSQFILIYHLQTSFSLPYNYAEMIYMERCQFLFLDKFQF